MTRPLIIFAAGFGTRMGYLTKDKPKPMVPFLGQPMIDHAIDLARDANVANIVSNTHYLPDVIEPHLLKQGVTVCREDPDILDTGGGLKACRNLLGDGPVFTLNPDAAWAGENPLKQLSEAWRPEMQALLLLVPARIAGKEDGDGDFSLERGEISRNGPYIYTGAQIIRTELLAEIPDRIFSLNRYWDRLLKTGAVHGLVHSGQWCDIGTPEGLRQAEKMVKATNV